MRRRYTLTLTHSTCVFSQVSVARTFHEWIVDSGVHKHDIVWALDNHQILVGTQNLFMRNRIWENLIGLYSYQIKLCS